MKLVFISIALFCLLFILSLPVKMAGNKLADLFEQEKFLEDSVNSMRVELAVENKIIDSLSSRKRIDEVAKSLGLEMNAVATKITRSVK